MTALYWLRVSSEHGLSDGRLRKAAADYAGISESDPRLLVSRGKNGKPCFPGEPLIQASVTHSGGIWLCALSSAPVGVDLQLCADAPSMKIAHRFFHPDEQAWLDLNPGGFFDVWCAKESYIKYTGDGMAAGLDGFSAVDGDGIAARINGAGVRKVDFLPGFLLYVCGGAGEIILKEMPGGDII